MIKTIVVAPHPDDETLGCGGTILKHKANGNEVHWLIVTHSEKDRTAEIDKVSSFYQFDSVQKLNFLTTQLDQVKRSDLIDAIGEVIQKIKPNWVYLPYPGDVHSDHKTVFEATAACTKSFRYPSVNRVLIYETLSETDYCIDPRFSGFHPNVFVNISDYIEKKIEAMRIYSSEIAPFPFPRSLEAIKSQAMLRGAASGFQAAESFQLVKELS